MFIVALTGGIGCGKSEASRAFSQLNVPIVDLDTISHQLTAAKQPLLDAISAKFGHTYITKDGALNREKMRKLVFDSPTDREALNAILHPAIYTEAVQQLAAYNDSPYAILAIPLLDKDSPYMAIINRVLVIDCDEETQIERVKQRSHLTVAQIKKIIQAQVPRQTRLAMADDVIENNQQLEELTRKVRKLHDQYMKTCIVNKIIS